MPTYRRLSDLVREQSLRVSDLPTHRPARNRLERAVVSLAVAAPAFAASPGNPGIQLTKTASQTEGLQAGDKITFELVVTNTGDVVLTDVMVSDRLLGIGAELAAASLAPGESVTFAPRYSSRLERQISQSDFEDGSFTNFAEVEALDPSGEQVTDSSSVTVTMADHEPAIELVKRADRETFAAAGDLITYTFDVTNTGNVTLINIVVSDSKLGLTHLFVADVLAPGWSGSATATYTVTEDDVDAGEIYNLAVTSGDPVNDHPPVTDEDEAYIALEGGVS